MRFGVSVFRWNPRFASPQGATENIPGVASAEAFWATCFSLLACNSRDKDLSTKRQTAEDLRASGWDIETVDELQFMQMLNAPEGYVG